METKILYTTEPPADFVELVKLYDALNWNSLNLTVEEMGKMCRQSWFAVYAFDGERLVGMGRVISDGVINGVICGVCVHPDYQSNGIGGEIVDRLARHCEENRIIPQLMCSENLEPYYEKHGFRKFTIGMKKDIFR
ncbi:GNAT family N-acetyltransferase [Bacillus sp. FJAT-27245]|uniref:GNAT family N-acetyltransferase n=1 Tax=Bacillus sp. FJAT-27245 TaxID=1684144 RepID=UPI0006A7D294|nr:GNAT family N-acetyltransferase [Bacillus sp. FJAT-27245]